MADTDAQDTSRLVPVPHPGAEKYQALIDGGQSPAEALAWKERVNDLLVRGGQTPEKIGEYWGVTRPDTRKLDATIAANVAAAPATSISEAFSAGLQSSVAGLAYNQKNPAIALGPEATLAQKGAFTAAQMASDLPVMMGGALFGGAAGGAVGAAGGPFGAAVGATMGAGAAGLGAPELIRDILMDQYAHPEGYKSWEETQARILDIAERTGKAALVGGLSFTAGKLAGAGVYGAGAARGSGLITAGELGGMAATAPVLSAGLEGHVPSADDFVLSAITVMGLHAAGALVGAGNRFVPARSTEEVAENLRDIYGKTGVMPRDAAAAAVSDPAKLVEVLAPRDVNGEPAHPTLTALRPPEPEPLHPEVPTHPPTTPEALATRTQQLALPAPEKPAEPGIAKVQPVERGEMRLSDGPQVREAQGEVVPLQTHEMSPKQLKDRAERSLWTNGFGDPIYGKGSPFGEVRPTDAEFVDIGPPVRLTADQRVQGLESGVEPVIKEVLGEATKQLPPGWRAEIISAERPGATVAGTGTRSQHADAAAMDITLIDPTGRRWTNIGKGPGTEEFEVYRRFAQDARNALDRLHPELHDKWDWGGNFLDAGPNQHDLMHFQLGGQSGRGTEARLPSTAGHLLAATPEAVTEAHLTIFRTLEGNATGAANHAVSPSGAVGRNQIMPTTATQYGFDPSKLQDTAYNDMVAKHIISDLSVKFDGNLTDMLVAYNAGPGRARAWIAGGRRIGDLPVETQRYLERAESHGYTKGDSIQYAQVRRQLHVQGDDGAWVPPDQGAPPARPAAGGGGGRVPPEPPEIPVDITPPGGRREPKLPSDEIKLSEDSLLDRMSDVIGIQPDRPSDWNPRKMLSVFQSQLAPARRLDTQLQIDQKNLDIEDLFRQTYAARERASYILVKGMLRPEGDRIADVRLPAARRRALRVETASMKAAYNAVREDGGHNKGFMEYMMAGRTVSRAAKGIKTGNELDTAKQVMALSSARAHYERGAQIMREVDRGVIEYGKDSGIFSAEQRNAILASDDYHLVYRRIIDPSYEPQGVSRAFRVGPAIKQMKGSERQIFNPIESKIDNIHTIVAMADRNRAIGSVIALIEGSYKNGTPPKDQRLLWHDRTEGSPSRPTDLLDRDGKPLPPEVVAAMEPFLAERGGKGLSANEFVYYRDGVREIWHAATPELAQLFKTTPVGEYNPIKNVLQKFAALQRTLIVSTPSFLVRATTHGQIATAALAEGGTKIPFADMAHGLMPTHFQTEAYWELVRNGGMAGAITDIDVNYIKKNIDKVFSETGTDMTVTNAFRHPIEALRAIHHLLNTASRVGMMQRLKSQGFDELKAATLARTGYFDYAEGRAAGWLNTWASYAPFMEAGFKDVDQTTQAFQRSPLQALATIAAVIASPTVANYVINYLADIGKAPDDPTRYDQLPRWMRDLYWVLPSIGGYRLRIMRPYVVAFIGATLPERMLDLMAQRDPGTFKELAKTFATQVVTPWMPNALTPALEQQTNHSFFTGRTLIPASLERLSGYMQYKPDTSEAAKAISRVLGPMGLDLANVSPITLQNYAQQWTGGLALQVLRILEIPFKPVGRPRTLADNPFYGSFFVRNSAGMAAQSIEDFYERATKFVEAHGDVQEAFKRGDMSLVSGPLLVEAASNVKLFTDAFAQQRAVLEGIYRSDKITDAEKLKHTDLIATGMIAMAQQGLKLLDDVEKLAAKTAR